MSDLEQGWLRRKIVPPDGLDVEGSWMRRPLGFNVMEPPVRNEEPTRFVIPASQPTRKYNPRNPFEGMTGEELSNAYRQHQNALLGVPAGSPEPEVPSFTEFFLDIGAKIDQAGAEVLGLFYKKADELIDRTFGTAPPKKRATSTDSFTAPDYYQPKGMGPEDAPYAYAGMRSAAGVISGPFHLIGGVGAVVQSGQEDGLKAAASTAGQSALGMLSLFNPLEPGIDGPERFHRSLNVMLAGTGGLKGFKSLRERGAVKTLVKEHGLEKSDAQFVVKEVQKGLAKIDQELGTQNSFTNAIDDLTQSRMRDIAKKIDPESFIFEAVRADHYTPAVTPTRDMNVDRGQNLTGTEHPLPVTPFTVSGKELDLTATPASMRTRADRLQLIAEEAQVEAVRTGEPVQFDAAAQLNGKAEYLRQQALIKEQADAAALDVPDVRFRKVQPAVNGDGPGPGRHSPDAGDPTGKVSEPIDVPPGLGEESQTGRITVSPIKEGDVVRDQRIWRDFFNRLKAKLPRQSDEVKKGLFDKDQAAIVVRSLRNSSTVAHEAGHQFNQLYSLSEGVPDGELKALLGDLDVPKQDIADEAIAEFVRGMMVNPEEAGKRAPSVAAQYEAKVPKHVKEAVTEAGQRIRRVMGQDAKDLTLSQVRLSNEKPVTALRERVREAYARLDTTRPYRTPLHKIAQAWVGNDDLAALQAAQEYIKEVAGLTEIVDEADASLLAARHRYVNNQVAETVAGGLRDEYGQILYHDAEIGLLQQVGSREVTIKGVKHTVPTVRQIQPPANTLLKNDPVRKLLSEVELAVHPDGSLMTLDGQRINVASKAEPMTLKWVLQPLRTGRESVEIGKVFEQFIVQGVSERALEIWHRNRIGRLPELLDKLLDTAPAETNKLIEATVNGVNKRTAKVREPLEAGLAVDRFMDIVYQTETADPIGELAVNVFLKALDEAKWKSKGATQLVREFQQDSRTLTGAGRGLIDDVSIAENALTLAKKNPEDFLAARQALGRYRAYSNALLQYLVKTGVIDEYKFRDIVGNNERYFDLARVMDDVSEMADVPKYHRDEIKALVGTAKGSVREIESPIVNLLANTEQAIRLGERNRMLNAFLDPIRDAKDPVAKNLLASVAEKVDGPARQTVKVFRNGKLEHWKVESAVYDALRPEQILSSIPKIILDVLSLPRNMILHGVTVMPNFIVRNAFRDYMDARIKGSGISIKQAFDALKSSDTDAGFYDYFGGGIAIWQDVALRKGWHKLQNDVLAQIAKDAPTENIFVQPKSPRLKLNNKGLLKKYGEVRGRAERASRLAEYRIALEGARKEIQTSHPDWRAERVEYNAHLRAGKASRDLIDFARGAKVWKAVNRLVPFVNARIQGFSTTANAIIKNKNNPKAMKALGLRMLTTMGSIAVAEYAINKIAGTEEGWRNQPAYLKDLYWLFPGPANVWIRIPKPFEWGVMASVFPRIAYNDWDGFFTDDASVLHGSVVQSLSPVAFDDLLYGPSQTFVELASNYDTFRRDHIIPEYEKDRALSERMGRKSASSLSQGIGGLINVDPRYIDHAIRGFTGNAGQTLTTVADRPDAESIPRYVNALIGLTTTDGSSNSSEVRKALRYASMVGVQGVFTDEFDALSDARNGDVFTGGRAVWEAKQRMVDKAKRINTLIEERTQGKSSDEQLDIVRDILNDFN